MSDNKQYEHIDSWKNSKSSFLKQLQLNKDTFENGDVERVPHWANLIRHISEHIPKRIVDIGCGTGCYYPICEMLNVEYIGYDYSQHAVDISKEAWGGNFVCKSYQEITSKDIREGDLVVANALCDVLPNGDECLEHLLSINANRLLIQRVRMTDKPNYFTEYSPYDITTYEFYHNDKQLIATIKNAGYKLGKITSLFTPSERIFDIEIRKSK